MVLENRAQVERGSFTEPSDFRAVNIAGAGDTKSQRGEK